MDNSEDKIFRNDPIYMRNLVGKSVKITTLEQVSHVGTVFVIDPVYKTVVLHVKGTEREKPDVVFILSHAIKSLEVLSDEVDKSYLEKAFVNDNSEAILKKKRLKKWFQHMYLNVDEVGDYLKIDDHLIVLPPYGVDNCICNNTIILERVQNIINSMPQEFPCD